MKITTARNSFPYSPQDRTNALLEEIFSVLSSPSGGASGSVTVTNQITGFATSANQTQSINELQSILQELEKDISFDTDIIFDVDNNASVVRKEILDKTTGNYTLEYVDLIGNSVTPSANLVSLADLLVTKSNTLTDNSGAVGTSSIVVFSANPQRNYLFVQNISDTPIWLNFGSAATTGSGSIKILPDNGYELNSTSGGYIIRESINIISSAANKSFTAKQA